MILGHVVYDVQFSFVTIYKLGKCMMPWCLKKSVQIWKVV